MMSSTDEVIVVTNAVAVADDTAPESSKQDPVFVLEDEEDEEEAEVEEFIDDDIQNENNGGDVDVSPPGSEMMDRENADADGADEKAAVVWSAGIMTALVGCVFCGPLAGCLLGTGAAVGAARPTAAGDMARSVGRCGLQCVACGSRRVKENDTARSMTEKVTEHQVYQKTRALGETAASQGWQRVKQVDEEYQVSTRSWQAAHSALDVVHGFVMGEKPTGGPVGEKAPSEATDPDLSASTEEASDSSADDDLQREADGGDVSGQGQTKKGGYAAVEGVDALL